MTKLIAILAGGRSTRMGTNKAHLSLEPSRPAETMLERIHRVASAEAITLIVGEDLGESRGPLSGIQTAFEITEADGLVLLSCDMPFVSGELLRDLLAKGGDRAIFCTDDGRAGFPFYLPNSAMPVVEKQLAAGELSLQKLAARLRARRVRLPARRAIELMNVNTPEEFRRAQRIAQKRPEPIIDIEGLSIHRGKTPILQNLNWRVEPGEHWAILGANGSGKTSLLSAITGYLTPSAGRITVLENTYGESDWRELRARIGLVSSAVRQMMSEAEPALFTVVSGKGAVIDYWGMPSRKEMKRGREILEQVECGYLAERPWAVLSQGERQRVLIGRALMSQPALLILDEPCAGLDPAAREHFLQFLERLGNSKGAPALTLVTHHVEEIVGPFSKALLLKDGKVLAAGDRNKVLTNKLLSETFGSPVHIFRRKGRMFLEVAPKRGALV